MADTNSDSALRALRRRVAAHRTLQNTANEHDTQHSLRNLLLLAGLKILDSKNLLGLLSPNVKGHTFGSLSQPEILRVMSMLDERVERLYSSCRSSGPSQSFTQGTIKLLDSHRNLILAPDLETLWHRENSLGYIYQCFNEPIRRAAQSDIQTSNKQIVLSELIAFTQIYTPTWVAQFLLDSTILPVSSVGWERLRLIDPACGSGHFLIEAFKFIHTRMLESGWCSTDATEHLITKTIAGVDIDPFATWVTALSLALLVLAEDADFDYSFDNLAVASTDSNPSSPSNLLGSLWKEWPAAHPLSKSYHVLVTNPPYIGRKLMSRQLKALLKKYYPNSYHDLCTAFLHRASDLMEAGGKVGFITQSSLMYLPSYERLRKGLVGASEESHLTLSMAVEAGSGVFPLQGGEKVSSMLLVATVSGENTAKPEEANETCKFIDIRSDRDKESALRNGDTSRIYERPLKRFGPDLRYAFHYSCPDAVFALLAKAKQLQEIADLRQGLATTDNNRFLRLWWEVNPDSLGQKWLPYVKGAGAERWCSTPRHVVNWMNDGAEIKESVQKAYPYLKGKTAWVVKNESFYFREGLSFSFVNTGRMAVRLLPAGCIFDVAGSAIFPSRADDKMALLAYLNSSLASAVASLFNPTINFQVGDLKRIPILNFSDKQRQQLQEAGQKCVELKATLSSKACFDFLDAPDLVQEAIAGSDLTELFNRYNARLISTESAIRSLENEIDGIVSQALSSTLSQNEAMSIASWLAKPDEERSSTKPLTAREFAQHLTTALLCRSVNFDVSEQQAPQQARILLADFDNRSHLAHALQLDETSLQSLEHLLSKPLSEFLRNDFTRILMKECYGAAPIVAFHPSNSNIGVITSLPAIHALAHNRPTLIVTSLNHEINGRGNQIAYDLLHPAIDVLKSDPDAHGKIVIESTDPNAIRQKARPARAMVFMPTSIDAE